MLARNWLITLACLLFLPAHASSASFNANNVQGIPTAGPNCYFAALAANSLLKTPALMMSADSAALLFLNPALCQTVQTPKPGDLGLEERNSNIWHVFTFLGPNRRFQKASPYESDPFTFADVSSQSATRFVHCNPMQAWVDESISKLPNRFVQLNENITEIENVIDSRNASKSTDTYSVLNKKMRDLSDQFGDPKDLIQKALEHEVGAKGISSTPASSITDPVFYKFIVAHPELANDQTIFAYLWLGSRLETIRYIFENYRFLKPAHLLP